MIGIQSGESMRQDAAAAADAAWRDPAMSQRFLHELES